MTLVALLVLLLLVAIIYRVFGGLWALIVAVVGLLLLLGALPVALR